MRATLIMTLCFGQMLLPIYGIKAESGESDLPDELLHALNELWTDSHLSAVIL